MPYNPSKEISFDLLSKTLLITSQLSYFYDDSGYTQQFENLAKVIGTVLNVEYCLIGFKEKDILTDAADWLPGEKTDDYWRIKKQYSKRQFEESLIGRSLEGREKDGFYLWNYNESGIFQNKEAHELFQIEGEVLDDYRIHILNSGHYSNFLTLGIYNKARSLVGYIHVVNKRNREQVIETLEFTAIEIETLKLISDSIGILLENLRFHKAELQDERAVNSWYGINDVNKLLREILQYLNGEFDSILCAYLMVAGNGFKDDPMMTILRDYYIQNEYYHQYVDYIKEHKDAPAKQSLSGQIILDNLKLEEGETQSSVRFLNRKKHDVEIIWKKIPSDYVIGIPIMRSSSDGEETETQNAPQDQIWGVICLFPKKEIVDKERIRNRLELFAKHVQTLIEKVIYKKRYQYVETLNNELQHLKIEVSSHVFYNHIVEIVKRVSDSECCSMFAPNASEDALSLVATTANKAYNKVDKHPWKIEELLRNDQAIYDLNNPDSISAKVFQKKQPVLVYDVEKCIHTNAVFMEATESNHKSLIAFPLIDSNGKVFAIIRCINKSVNDRLLHVFVQGDLDLLQLIGKALSGYIKNREFYESRKETMTHFAHENRGPMQAIGDWMSILQFTLRRFNMPFSKDLVQSLNGLDSNFAVVKQNIQNTEVFFLNDEGEGELDMSICNLKEILAELTKLFIGENKLISRVKEDVFISGNKDAIYQVFYNLVLNAKRYSGKGGKIYVNYTLMTNYDNEGWHKISVVDFGIGIEEGEEVNVFKKYFRTEKAKRKYPTGTGIGLSVCKSIMDKHRGKIQVTSNHTPTEISVFFPPTIINESI